jgi:hypothetical protein
MAADLDDGTLTIEGTDRRDIVVVEESGRNIVVTFNGDTERFRASRVENIEVDLKGGNDQLTVRGIGRNADIDDLSIDTGDGNDQVTLTDVTVEEDIEIETGAGRDRVTLTNVRADRVDIDTGDGRDDVTLTNVRTEELEIDTGDGDDRVVITRSRFSGEVSVDLEAGDDSLEITRSIFGDEAFFDGGDDFDELLVAGNNQFEDDFEDEDFEVGGSDGNEEDDED